MVKLAFLALTDGSGLLVSYNIGVFTVSFKFYLLKTFKAKPAAASERKKSGPLTG